MFREISLPTRIKITNGTLFDELSKTLDKYGDGGIHLFITTKHLYGLYFKDLHLNRKIKVLFARESSIGEASLLYEKYLKDTDVVTIIGAGGGKIIDIAKYLAFLKAVPMISVPTTLSNDGICSVISVLTDQEGKKRSLRSAMPSAVLADLQIIKRSPIKYIIAGIGDLIAKISALKDWKLAYVEKGEKFDELAYMFSYVSSSNLLRKLILEVSGIKDVTKDEFLEELFYGLVFAGMSMYLAGSSRPASGAEHMISHAIDYLYPSKSCLHGFQVAYGTLIAEKIRGEKIDYLIDIFRKVNLPTSYRDLKLSRDEIINAIIYAPNTRKRYTILNKAKLSREIVEKVLL